MLIDHHEKILRSFLCVKCDIRPSAELHHPRIGAGMSKKNSDWLRIPLCLECHNIGKNSIHYNSKDEMKLLAKTTEMVFRRMFYKKMEF